MQKTSLLLLANKCTGQSSFSHGAKLLYLYIPIGDFLWKLPFLRLQDLDANTRTRCIQSWCSRFVLFTLKFSFKIVMFTGANILIASVASIFFMSFFPQANSHTHGFIIAAYYIFGIWLVVNIFFNYFACSLISAGHPNVCHDPGDLLSSCVWLFSPN